MFSLRQGMLFKFFVFLIELNWIIIVSICLWLDHFTEKREIDAMKAALHNLLAIFMVNLNHLLPSKDDWTNRDLILSSSHGRRYLAPKLLFCFQSPKRFFMIQFQDLLSEVRQIQKLLQSTDERRTRDTPVTNIRTDDLTGFWNTITEERQQRLQLDHFVRKMELDVLEVKTQVQSCKARLPNEQPPPVSPSMRWNCCPLKCCGSSCHQAVKHCCSCAEDFPIPHPKLRTSTSLFTLV